MMYKQHSCIMNGKTQTKWHNFVFTVNLIMNTGTYKG